MKTFTIALAGNPNSGKSTIFNNLTGARQHVGNWPGVTVEKKEGICKFLDYEIKVVDLPGTYSLSAYSLDELIARNFLVEERPDVVVDIVDTSNLERNLYLTLQIIELRLPLVVCLNMFDLARARGIRIDVKKLEEYLGAICVPTVGHRNEGTENLKKAILKTYEENIRPKLFNYGEEIEEEIKKIEKLIPEKIASKYPPRWVAVKLLEGDKFVEKVLKGEKPKISEKEVAI